MKENRTQMLSTEKLGDEKRIRAVLADWSVDAQAVERMLDQHRALRAEARRALRSCPVGGLPVPRTFHGAHTAR